MSSLQKIGKGVVLLAIEVFVFGLFVVFMESNRTGNVVALLLLFVAMGILLKTWKSAHQALTGLFREMKALAILGFVLLILILPFVFRASPYLIHICVMAGLYAILALGLNFQLGSTNVVNFATAA